MNFYSNVFSAKQAKKLEAPKLPWACWCLSETDTALYKVNPPYLCNCLDCGARRPS